MNDNLRVEKLITALQRPIILVLMAIACPSMLILSGIAFVNLVIPGVSGEQPLKEGGKPSTCVWAYRINLFDTSIFKLGKWKNGIKSLVSDERKRHYL